MHSIQPCLRVTGKCRREVTRRTKRLACERCDDWYHADCVGLGRASERVLRSRNLLFVCDGCLSKVKDEWAPLTVRSEVGDSDTEDTLESEAKPAPGGGEQDKDQPQESQDHSYCGTKKVSGSESAEGPSGRDAPESDGEGVRDFAEVRVEESAGNTTTEEGSTVRK